MGSYSTSKKYITTSSKAKTVGAQDNAIIADEGATVNVLDEGAIKESFTLADNAFDAITDNTANTLELAGIYSDNESENFKLMLDTVKDSFTEGSNLAAYALEQQGDVVNNAMAAVAQREEFSDSPKADISEGTFNGKVLIGYGAGILGMFMIWQGMKKS